MKLVLRETVDKLGEAGEVITVKPGHARNYLLPQGLAYVATEATIGKIEEEQRQRSEKERRAHLEVHRRAARLEGMTFRVTAKASDEGKLFGSVNAQDIVEQVAQSDLGFELDRHSIILAESIKMVGEYRVPVRLASDLEVEVRVTVEAEAV